MKKFLVVLTILVLVAGFAFATVTGYVEAQYKFDFTGAKELTYDIEGKHSKVTFTLSTDQVKVDGSNKPYATVTIDVELSAKFEGKKQILDYDASYKFVEDFTDFAIGVKLADFRIVGENWEIDFLKAIGVGDYAKSAWEVDDRGDDAEALDAHWDFGKSKGITVTYEGYKVGVSAERRKPDYVLDVKLRAESKELTFAEGVTGQAAVGIGATKKGKEDMTFDFGASVKASYATDDLSVKGAVDLQYVAKDFDLDVAVNVAVKPVTVDVYYATSLEEDREHSLIADAENVLSVKAVVDLDPVKVTLYGEDLINTDRLIAVKEEGKFGALSEDAQFGIYPSLKDAEIFYLLGMQFKNIWFVNAGVGYDVMENLNVNFHVGYLSMNGTVVILDDVKFHASDLVFKVGAKYTLEKVALTADAYVGKSFAKIDDQENNSDLLFGCEIGASSDSLVENATLSAKLHLDKKGVIKLYDSTVVDAYAGDPAVNPTGMYFQVACKVTF
jgi:hypothetical protein